VKVPGVPQASLIGHNDIAPYNVCFNGDEVPGVFDWDLAGPTTPLMELAFIAWNCVPLWQEVGDETSAERIRRICSAYGGVYPTEIVDVVPRRIQMMLDWIRLGRTPMRGRLSPRIR
jgi:aminoglycoside phosphotransferase (APT) family kinase protein